MQLLFNIKNFIVIITLTVANSAYANDIIPCHGLVKTGHVFVQISKTGIATINGVKLSKSSFSKHYAVLSASCEQVETSIVADKDASHKSVYSTMVFLKEQTAMLERK